MRLIFLGIAALLGAAAPAFAQGQYAALCAVTCVKPISIPDRWDDTTPIAGYTGGTVNGKRMPDWRSNGAWNSETLTNDVNANGLYDPGDGYEDGNGNGVYDAEAYDPLTTGYNPGPSSLAPGGDLGLELTLKTDNDSRPTPGQYQPVAYPAANRGTPIVNVSEDYQRHWMNWETCGTDPDLVGRGDACLLQPGNLAALTNQVMRDLIAQDPDASWDPVTSSVQGSRFALSPRVIFLPVHDPRVPVTSGANRIIVTKIAAFFMEQMEGAAVVRGRFLRAIGTGESCPTGGDGFIVECPTPAHPATWGQVKNLYR